MRPPTSVARIPAEPGVYRFRDRAGGVLYIGRAVNLRRRVRSYWGDLRGRAHLAEMVARIAHAEVLTCDSDHEAAWLERNLLERHMPEWNRTAGGQETPALIRLDRQPRAPGLTVVVRPRPGPHVQHFGPYLGGLKVRLAVSALHRVLPLAYTGEDLTGAERDMAVVRGVGPEHREEIARTTVAVLNRNRSAVARLRRELTTRRDAAASEHAYELASRVQSELAALEWIVSPQSATTLDRQDLEFCGWADGMLLRFEVRAGRLCAWQQEECTAERAGPLIARTPSKWRRFAQRNSELAARMTNAAAAGGS